MAKIQAMLDEQKRLLGEGLDISKDGNIVYVSKKSGMMISLRMVVLVIIS